MLVDKINAYLATEGKTVDEAILTEVAAIARYAFERQFGTRESKTPEIWLSGIGKCTRMQAYNLLGFEPNGKEVDSRTKMVFFAGDMAELAIVQVARQAGCDITDCGLIQKKVEIDGARGRVDGILNIPVQSFQEHPEDVPVTTPAKQYLVEVKSMTSYGFEEFERGQLDISYRYQVNAYLEALGLEKAIVVALNKDAGVLNEAVISKDEAIVADIKARIVQLRAANRENLPPRPYSPDEKGILPWNCLYCNHWKTCWPKAERVLVNKRYKLRANEEIPHAAA